MFCLLGVTEAFGGLEKQHNISQRSENNDDYDDGGDDDNDSYVMRRGLLYRY